MSLSMRPVEKHEKEILRNLLEKYSYEFSQYDNRDVDALGLYGYDYLDCYWTEPNRFAWFILYEDKLAGFALVNDYVEPGQPPGWNIAEFFILYKYRRMGAGRFAAKALFDSQRGRWELMRHPANLPSVAFWDKVVAEYTGGRYTCVSPSDRLYPDGTPGDLLQFDNR